VNRRGNLSTLTTLAIIAGVMLFLTPFYYFDRMDLARPSLASAAAIGCAIATYWKARTRLWFWTAIAAVVSLHVYAVLRIQWTDERVSIYVLGTITLIDYGATLALIKVIEIICRSPEEAEKQRSKTLS
jgi:hypothetical protein